MARRRRTDIEVQRVKSSILKAALDLFDRHEYSQLSMRNIAKKAECSVATIYNYYPSKDHLYMDVLRSGFQLLHRSLKAGIPPDHPDNNLRTLAGRLLKFSINHKNYYNLMFSSPFPKIPEHPETGEKMTAPVDKEEAIETMASFNRLIKICMDKEELKPPVDLELLARMFWAMSHGLISLYHSQIFQALGEDPEAVFNTMMDSFVSCLGRK